MLKWKRLSPGEYESTDMSFTIMRRSTGDRRSAKERLWALYQRDQSGKIQLVDGCETKRIAQDAALTRLNQRI